MTERRTILINKIHYPVQSLGYGNRIGIWLQGCTIHCSGCLNRDTWVFDKEKEVSISSLMEQLADWVSEADGITISGGEPFDQPEALHFLLQALRSSIEGDILVFSGYTWEHLQSRHSSLLALIDVLVSDPYRASSGQTLAMRGSDNQRAWLLSDLGRLRYPSTLNEETWDNETRQMDVEVDADCIWMAGIPKPDDLVKLKQLLAARGLGVIFSCDSGTKTQD